MPAAPKVDRKPSPHSISVSTATPERLKAVEPPARPMEPESECVSNVELRKETIEAEVSSVAVDWRSLRSSPACFCGYRLDSNASVRIHCRRCGSVFCKRCIQRKLSLPGHLSKKPMPVCNSCARIVISQLSEESSFAPSEVSDAEDL